MYHYLLFDLDGTLCNTGDGILRSVQYALGEMGYSVPAEEELRCFIGPPLVEQFMAFCRIDEAEAKRATAFYRKRYSVTGIYEASPYPGIPELLARLRDAGYVLGVATSKPNPYATQLLKHVGLAGYFSVIAASELDGTRDTKREVVLYALERLGISRDGWNQVVLIGDRKYDILGAREVGIDAIGVRYGFAPPGELEEAGAVVLADDVEGLARLLLGERNG